MRRHSGLKSESRVPSGIGRRAFVGGLGASALAVATVARAQDAATMLRVALVSPTVPVEGMVEGEDGDPNWVAFLSELRALGFVEGENMVLARYSGIADVDRRIYQIRRYQRVGTAAALQQPDLVFVGGNSAMAHGAARADPDNLVSIVAVVEDARGAFLVTNYAQPGANVTGVSLSGGTGTEGERLRLLREVVPGVDQIAYLIRSQLVSPNAMGAALLAAAEEATARLGVDLLPAHVDLPIDDAILDESALKRAFFDALRGGANGLCVAEMMDPNAEPAKIGALAFAARLPAIAPWREFAESGGLLSYGANVPDMYRKAAGQVAAVLGGADPAEMPILEPNKMELVVNLNTARYIGISVPDAVLGRASEVIGG